MERLSFDMINNAVFRLYEGNPVIKNRPDSFVVADPTVLTPRETPDGRWHLFCHTFYGIDQYVSDDGIAFDRCGGVVSSAMRPDVNYENGTYYLFYEKTRNALMKLLSFFGVKWKSEICLVTSEDLVNWSEPELVLGKTRSFEEDKRGVAISNPFMIRTDEGYRLYYSCGQTYVSDCGFCEPTHINYAESEKIDGGYIASDKPIISPDENSRYLNICSGCIKVYRLKDCYIGLQNGIFRENGKSHSAIMLLRSQDGKSFEFVKPLIVPQRCGKSKWMAQYVYACCLVRHGDSLRIYFNARNTANSLTGRESIGFAEAALSFEAEG